MSREGLFDMEEAQTLQEPQELLRTREQFYRPVSLDTNDIFCGDERGGIDELYIHVFGGALNIAYNLAVLREAAQPGSVTDTFEQEAAAITPVVSRVGAHPGVHSDTHAEHGDAFRADSDDGPVGCKYAEARQAISQLIADTGDEILADAKALRPELFQSVVDDKAAADIVAAHERLAQRTSFFTSGRRVVQAARQQGAKVVLVEGDHVANGGVINLDPDTSPDNNQALAAGLAFYDQDSWATAELYRRLSALYPYDQRHEQIADLIDTIGTMRALGIETIAVRRSAPAEA